MDASPAPLGLAVPAPCYLVGAVVLGASTVVAPKRSPTAYVTLLAMAGSVYRYITAPHGSDFGLAMVFTTYVFQVCAMRIRSTAERVADSKLPKRQLDWLVVTFLNPRMVGWGGPVGPLQPRARFIAEQIVQLIPSLLAIDLCHGYFAASTWYSHDAPLFGVRIATLPVWKQATHTAAWAIYAYLLWFLPYKIFAVASVSLRFTEPQHWPQLCASWTEADSVSALWGRVWHQSHRRTYTTLAEAAADRGQLSPAVKRYFKVTTAFTISAVVHAAGSLALPPDPVTGDRGCKGALVFFALQALAVCGERWLGQLTTVRPPRLLRYAWLVCWGISTLILSGWMDELVARRSIPPGVRSVLVDLWTSR